MGLNVSAPQEIDFETVPPGQYAARCYMVADLGLHRVMFNNEEKFQPKVRISWELPTQLMQDGRPFSISARHTLSLSTKSNLYKDLIAWRGRPFTDEELEVFDLFKLVGAKCLINVVHNEKDGTTYANIGSIMPLPKEMACPDMVNTPVKFAIDDPEHCDYLLLPEWLQKKINMDGMKAFENTPEPAAVSPQRLPVSPHAVYEEQQAATPQENLQRQAAGTAIPDEIVEDDIPF